MILTYFILCLNPILDSLPVLDGGRVKPMLTLANESMKYLTEKSTGNEYSTVASYCLLSTTDKIMKLKTPISNTEVQNFLKLETNQKDIQYEKLINMKEDIRFEFMGQKTNTPYKKALNQLQNKINLYQSIRQGDHWNLYYDKNWLAIKDMKIENVLETQNNYINDMGNDYLIEIYYIKYKPFLCALIISIIAFFSYSFAARSWIAPLMVSLTWGLELIGLILRIFISHRAPITNMYETVLFSGFAGLTLSFIIFFLKKDTLFIRAGIFYNMCCLLMMQLSGSMLDPSINPLVPVLRDNFWLSTHVTTIILSYAALALSWALSNYGLICIKWKKWDKKQINKMSDQVYTSLKFGVVLLAAGIILGGVWADYSWGRFWGWDPKETWSLIVLLLYTAILHGKYTQWINPTKFLLFTSLAFLGVMMAWFGVNYILASGLHSYGFSEGGAIFLIGFTVFQLILVIITKRTQNFMHSK